MAPDPTKELLENVQKSFDGSPDRRLRTILQSLARHLHEFVAELQPTLEEWQHGIEFLTAVGKACTPDRQEFILLSDVLGLSTAVELTASTQDARATPGTVLGPFHVSNSPPREPGSSLIDTDDGGAHLCVSGIVTGTDGTPISGASIDVWSCASNGLYPAQDPKQAVTNLRGLLQTDSAGRYSFVVLRPVNYSIPMDGPVGALMNAVSRSPQRAAHVHMIVSAPGFQSVTTHLFDSECPYLKSDAVFSTRPELIECFRAGPEGELAASFNVSLARSITQHVIRGARQP